MCQRSGIRFHWRQIRVDLHGELVFFHVYGRRNVLDGLIDDFVHIDLGNGVLFPARLSFGIEEDLIHHIREPSRLIFNHRGILLHALLVADDTTAQIVRRRANHSQGRPQLVGHAGREFHLKPPEGSGTLAGNDDRDQARSEYEQYSKADGHVSLAYLLHRPFERSQPMLDQKNPALAEHIVLRKSKSTRPRTGAASPPTSAVFGGSSGNND